MSDRPSHHLRLAVAVRRRWAAVGALESAAVCATLAALLTPPAVLLARRTGLPVGSVVCLIATAAVLAALAHLARRWPTVPAAAMRIDRRFGWDDLLLTARTTAADDDPFAAAVRAAADHRCRTARPSDVPVARLGRRAWTTLAVVTAAAIAGALLMPNQLPSVDADPPPTPAPPTASVVPAPRRTGTDPIDDRPTPPEADLTPPPTDSPSDHANPPPAPSVSMGSPGRGRATAAASPPAPPPNPISLPPTLPRSGTAAAAPAGGGVATHPPSPGTDAPTGLTVAADSPSAVPPWQSPDWATARRSAAAAVSSAAVPPDDRDLVRRYFDPSPLAR